MDYDQDSNDSRNGRSPDDMDVDEDKSEDLLDQLNGMFRLLDLIGEQGSGGIGKYHCIHCSSKITKVTRIFWSINIPVDKVVIDQESFSHLINKISPGAYTSLTKISFSKLDKSLLRPIGVYGSRTEIVKLLRSFEAIDDPSEYEGRRNLPLYHFLA
jgi:hypothetical protein